jgi:acetylornithine deacetylase/succinyl-diaminopimelate desuccinylase-like protein
MYKELVETNTTLSAGDCTLAATRLLAHMKAAGFSDADAQVFTPPGHPKEGGLTAILHGTSKTAKPILLLGHLDVVEAKRADWTRDPFKLIEENGYFYGRGTSDMKAMSAAWVDILDRFKSQGYHPKRDIKLALTCGEEGAPFNGAQWLTENEPDKVKAAFGLNEGGGGRSDGHGKVVIENIQVGEKVFQDFRLEARNVGGHSSVPIKDNAIYELAAALLKVRDYEFPVTLSDTTRVYFAKAGAARGDAMGKAMMAIAKDPHDAGAEKIVSSDRSYHSMLRTTCVATLLDGGHADNALPQRAGANINCRIFPSQTAAATQAALTAAIGDPGISVTATQRSAAKPHAPPPPLDPKVIGPAEALVAKYFPGVPLIPDMSTGATDGIWLDGIGVPVYGAPGGWGDPDGNGTHGLNERRSVHSLFVGRDFLTDLVKSYAEAG